MTPVTSSFADRNESDPREPLTTVGVNCHSVGSSLARSHRESSAAGTSPVAAARSMTDTTSRSASTGDCDGRPASTTTVGGSEWMAAIAAPTDAAKAVDIEPSGTLEP